ncbi:MAG: YebC/PmpR family DNA-binding transcriptional regulator, partial [Chloroflexus sp.]|nr:YebC/PmpR family DNA-binding transcriptional regulator [Chloroflexus sp.]
ANNMPNENIHRAIDRGLGKSNEAVLEEIFYEGYGPGGVAILIEAATDNRNRTNSEVRATFNKNGGNPGEPGSVSWMFEQKGLITVDLSATKRDPDELQLIAIDAGADDVVVDDETLEIYCEWTQLNAIRQALLDQGVPISNAEKIMRAKTLIQPDEKDALAALRLIEKLEDLDDVQKVYSNLDITAELVARFDA